MFRHHGKSRTFWHNIKIASLLSFVAGIVNVAGFFAVQRLTTNVTGHFAFFVDEILRLHFWNGFIYFFYIFFFFLGSFTSSFMVEFFERKNIRFVYIVPTLLESLLLLAAAFFGKILISDNPNLLAFLLLFAMGLQNSLVTSISNATVRTTHLTGLFTDLGIELSQLFFYQHQAEKDKLYKSIRLRLTIISFFFLGGLVGGILYSSISLYVLAFAAVVLISGIAYDAVKMQVLQYSRKTKG
ncbi:MAG: hypothetical protein RIT03_323 [Bacteroidota bacterium]|jgi:uncharacterized membrane protein YoaK (UPF0700 family)